MREYTLTLYASLKKVVGTEVRVDWAGLPTILRYYEAANKRAVGLWCPAQIQPGGHRAAEHVQCVHLGVLDLDRVNLVDVLRVLHPRLARYRHGIHSTWRDTEDKANGIRRLRLILDLSRPVLAHEWREFWLRLAHWSGLLGGGLDEKASDPARFYYLPSGPRGSREDDNPAILHWQQTGAPLDVDALLAQPLKELRGGRPTYNAVESLVTHLYKAKRTRDHDLANALAQVNRGARFADIGNRDNILFHLARVLVKHYTAADIDEFCALFAPAIRAMSGDAEPLTLQTVRNKFERVLARERPETDDDEIDEVRRRWAECLARSNRDAPYDSDQLRTIAASIGVMTTRLDQAWVLQRQHAYWLLTADAADQGIFAGPFLAKELPEAAEVALAPADSAGVVVSVLRGQRVGRKTAADLVADHGTVLHDVVRDIAADRSTLDTHTRTLTLATCPRRSHEAECNPEIARYLELLAGPRIDRLLHWLWAVPRLEEPSAALYLHGEGGIGKGMLPFGLAQYWIKHGGPTMLEDALNDKNEAVATCPLVWADERIPEDRRGQPRLDDVKALVGAFGGRFRAMYQAVVSYVGALRLIVSANRATLLLSDRDTSAEDVRALAARFVYIPCIGRRGQDVRGYLQQIGGVNTTRGWVNGGGLCRHVEYLRATLRYEHGMRFLVDGDADSPLSRALVSGSGLRAAVCHWLVQWLVHPNKIDGTAAGREQFAVDTQRLWASPRGLHEAWSLYEVSWRGGTPPIARIRSALSGLSDRTESQTNRGVTARVYGVQLALLEEWAERHGYAQAGELRRLAQTG